MIHRFAANRAALLAAAGLSLLVLACLFGPELSPHDPDAIDFEIKLQGPTLDHPLGTDGFGRDLGTRLLEGGRYSLFISAIALAVVLAAGFLYGAAAGLAGGRVEETLMRLLDGFFALPRLPVGIVILIFVGLNGNAVTLALSIAAVSWLTTARLVRGQIVALRSAEFVRAAQSLGARRRSIAVRHVLPNVAPVLLLAGLLELPAILLGEALFSVLGLGMSPPQATWGTIAYDAERWGQFWAILLPSLAIGAFAVLTTFVADGIGEALDPRAPTVRRRRLGLAATLRRAVRG